VNGSAGGLIPGASLPLSVVGGTLHANPFDAQLQFVTDGAGDFSLAWPLGPGLPSGQGIYLQCIVQDVSSVAGLSLSNARISTTP
jgi:hypothetical protein